MKKILLLVAVFFAVRASAQIINGSFENWGPDTSYFAGYSGIVAGDTFPYRDPLQWTSANGISGAASLGGRLLVTQSPTAYIGESAIQLTTDTLTPVVIPVLGTRQLTVPGLVLNGIFPIGNITQNILGGHSVSPAVIPGAGQPFTQRLDSFFGYFQYTPVLNTFTNTPDTCVMWATLRKGSTVVANAEFTTNVNTNGTYAYFSTPFVYASCETPDTLVILLASSLPKFGGIINGNTELVPGSVLLVDGLGYDTLAAGRTIDVAVNDVDTTFKNTPDTIPVVANDISCNSLSLTLSSVTTPLHGTATIWNNEIIYTPNTGYLGGDTFFYTITDANNATSTAMVLVYVEINVGISEANEIPVKMFPVPAANELHLQFENNGKTTARIFDVVGNLVSTLTLKQNDNNINISTLTNGVYGLQLVDESNNIIARGKFVISK